MNASPFLSGPRIVVRGDPVRRGIQKYPPGHSALDAESRNTHHVIPRYDAVSRKYPPLDPASLCGVTHATGPRIVVRGDPVRRGIQKYPLGHSALDAESRNTRAGNTGKGNTHKRHFSGPRIVVRGDPHTGPRIVVRGDTTPDGLLFFLQGRQFSSEFVTPL